MIKVKCRLLRPNVDHRQVLYTACRNRSWRSLLLLSLSLLGYHSSTGQVTWTLSDAIGLFKELRALGPIDHNDPSFRFHDLYRKLEEKLQPLTDKQMGWLQDFTAKYPNALDANKLINNFPTVPEECLDDIHTLVRCLGSFVFLIVFSSSMALSKITCVQLRKAWLIVSK